MSVRWAVVLLAVGCARGSEPTEATRPSTKVAGSAEIRIDRYGWPHVRAQSLRDAAVAQGYAMARDRMPQLEFFRRAASGRLAEVYGSVSAKFIETDVLLRTLGLRRTAQQMWDALPEGRSRTLFEGFADGVNLYLEDLRSGARRVPRGAELLLSPNAEAWTPVDSFAVLRLLVFYLSFRADIEIEHTWFRDRAQAVFAEADPSRADLLARRGFFSDLLALTPPSTAQTVPDFYAQAEPARAPRRNKAKGQRPGSLPLLDATRALASLQLVLGATDRGNAGSNGWAVPGSRTASGHALVAGDPHQGLLSPAFLYGVHVVVTEGPDRVEWAGSAFPGIPGVIFGHSGTVAWAITNAAFDQVDVYDETVTRSVSGAGSVLFKGQQVPLQTRVENIPTGLLGVLPVTIEVVPHHGPILPRFSRDGVPAAKTTSGHELSVRWVGSDATHEVEGLVGLIFAPDVPAAIAAVRNIEAPSLSFVLGDRAGNIAYQAAGRAALRAPGARTYDPARNPSGTLPAAVLPGTGEAEWTGFLDPTELPHALNPPFIATANNDLAGLSRDGNPFDERVYLGFDWAEGFRCERIAQRLSALGTGATRDDMESIQNDHRLLVGERLTPFLIAALQRLEAEWTTPGTHADLSALAKRASGDADRLRDVAARMSAWGFQTPSGLEPDADDRTRTEAVAAALFHAWLARVFEQTFGDELDALQEEGKPYVSPEPRRLLFALIALLEHPDATRTRDPATGQSVLWDHLSTREVRESRDATLLDALVRALADLEAATKSPDVAQWQWGKVHTARLSSVYPHVSLSLGTDLSIPQYGDGQNPRGFPRQGGIETIDQGWPSFEDSSGRPGPSFHYTVGPAERRSVEVFADGPEATISLAGGESADPFSPHFDDEVELWRSNKVHPMLRKPAEIEAATERRITLQPGVP